MDLDDEPLGPASDPVGAVERQPLDRLSHGELTERIDRLRREIDRTKTMIAEKQSGLSAAEQIFKPKE